MCLVKWRSRVKRRWNCTLMFHLSGWAVIKTGFKSFSLLRRRIRKRPNARELLSDRVHLRGRASDEGRERRKRAKCAAARCMDVFGAVGSRCQSKQFVSAATEKAAAAESLSAGPSSSGDSGLIKIGWFFPARYAGCCGDPRIGCTLPRLIFAPLGAHPICS